MGFDAGWLAARRRYDEAALYQPAIAAIQAWGAELPDDRPTVVVDLGSGTGAALVRVRSWLAPHPLRQYAVDQDADLLARATSGQNAASSQAAVPPGAPFSSPPVPLVGDLLAPLDPLGGPPDGTVDLVLGHALADLLPLDRLAARAAALVRPGGLVHLPLAYDGETTFGPTLGGDQDAREARILDAFHRHMDRPRLACPSYGGSTTGRRLASALDRAGLEIVESGPSTWHVAATDGQDGEQVLSWLLRFITSAVADDPQVSAADLAGWLRARQASLSGGQLTARVVHRDVLARRPSP